MSQQRESRAGDLPGLFCRELDALYRFARHLLGCGIEAEDALHDAYVRVSDAPPRPRHLENTRAFVFKVVRNVCIDRLRKRARHGRVFVESPAMDELPQERNTATPETDLLVAESFLRISEAMAALPAEEAQTLSLVAVEGLSYRATAEVMDVPIGTVRSRLSRARAALRAALQEDEELAGGAAHSAPDGRPRAHLS